MRCPRFLPLISASTYHVGPFDDLPSISMGKLTTCSNFYLSLSVGKQWWRFILLKTLFFPSVIILLHLHRPITVVYCDYSKLGMTAQVSLFLLDILWYTGVSLYQIPPSCPDRILAF
ncbi:hypothetical protein ZOSMA_378G00040 [Zostera marina]|uniref:Uncharacterized protein n=1 Tax=Zostera marina TaxID=29655 RepID=A0A0K9P7X0_ZOSMR|nr:hypothetical protein ZOSMA_378G00040 [Zostera marina]